MKKAIKDRSHSPQNKRNPKPFKFTRNDKQTRSVTPIPQVPTFSEQITFTESNPILLATSAMSKDFIKETRAIVDANYDPSLFESNCYFKPKIDSKSVKLAQ